MKKLLLATAMLAVSSTLVFAQASNGGSNGNDGANSAAGNNSTNTGSNGNDAANSAAGTTQDNTGGSSGDCNALRNSANVGAGAQWTANQAKPYMDRMTKMGMKTAKEGTFTDQDFNTACQAGAFKDM